MFRRGEKRKTNSRTSSFNKDRDQFPREPGFRGGVRRQTRFRLPKGTKVDYKDVALLQRYITDRGKIISRRFTGVTAKEQRAIAREIRKARFLGLLPILGAQRK